MIGSQLSRLLSISRALKKIPETPISLESVHVASAKGLLVLKNPISLGTGSVNWLTSAQSPYVVFFLDSEILICVVTDGGTGHSLKTYVRADVLGDGSWLYRAKVFAGYILRTKAAFR